MEDKNLPVTTQTTELANQETPEYPWLKMSEKAKQALEISKKVQRTKHGLFANIPIICKASSCPYKETCAAYQNDMAPENEPCVVEIALLVKLYEDYTKELQIDTTQIVNIGLVKTLIEAEITIARCDAILAKDANIIQDIPISVTPKGDVVTQPNAHPALAIRDKAYTQRNNAYTLLNSTPKDKAKQEGSIIIDPSTYASRILRKYQEQVRQQEQEGKIIDVEATKVEEPNGSKDSK
jgi:hypothetical protein